MKAKPSSGGKHRLATTPTPCWFSSRAAWARAHALRFEAVGLNIEPPLEDVAPDLRPGTLRMPRALLRRLWLARENILYPSAQTAYVELIVAMHLDGYEVHTYQMPVIADDRRAGTSLIQRALDIVDLPSDVDVLMCSSSAPIDLLGNDLGGALIASYGASADAIGIGSIGDGDPAAEEHAPLPWPALRRDALLAAQPQHDRQRPAGPRQRHQPEACQHEHSEDRAAQQPDQQPAAQSRAGWRAPLERGQPGQQVARDAVFERVNVDRVGVLRGQQRVAAQRRPG